MKKIKDTEKQINLKTENSMIVTKKIISLRNEK